MTLRVNPVLADALNAATGSSLAWSTALKTALGASRRVICVRHANASTPVEDVFALGTVFRNAALTGDMKIAGGVINHYGFTSDLTVSLAADLATGKSVLRIEGNGNWIEGTLGLPGSNCDFVLPVNPTATNSIAVTPNLRIKPPPFLQSGTGYTPPALDANAPTHIIIESWIGGAFAGEAGRLPFDERIANLVYEDAAVAADAGDVRVTQSTQTVTHGEFIFGATMWSMNGSANTTPGETLHQVLIGCRPTEANWPRYPRFGGYRKGTRTLAGASREYGISNTFPPAFKAKICAGETVLYTHEMHDGLAINSEELSLAVTKSKPLRPFFHCGSMLPWESHKPKLSAKAHHYFPGLHPDAIRYSMGKEKAAANQTYPLYRQAQPSFSSGLWHAVGKWPLPCSVEALTADQATRQDPYLFAIGPSNAEGSPWGTRGWMTTYYNVPTEEVASLTYGLAVNQGWGYEPGSHSMHDHFTGPGGIRIDRAVIPGPIAIHMTNPTWIHLRDNTPITEMVDHFNKAYFNHEWHLLTDARTFESLPVAEVLDGKWGHCRTFYGGNDSYVPGGVEYSVPVFSGSGLTQDTLPCDGAFVDENYRMPWNGSAIDNLHNYSMPGLVALLYNSPMHAYAQKLRYFASIMCQLGGAPATTSVAGGTYAIRKHAWRLVQAAVTWKLAANHPRSISRADMEARIIGELTAVYNSITIPLNVTNDQTPYFKMLRNFGVPVNYVSYEVNKWPTQSMGLTFYMALVLQFWRQSGLWRRMYDHSTITRDALLTIVQTLDVASFGFILETEAAYIGAGGSVFNGKPIFMAGGTETSATPDVPTGWADWQARVWPKTGAEDMIHAPDGTLKVPTSDEHLRMQWVLIRRDYFPDVPCVYDVAAACAMVEGWQAAWAAHVAAKEAIGPRAASQNEWSHSPAYGRILPPVQLEP